MRSHEPSVLVTIDKNIATIQLNRLPLNAIDTEFRDDLAKAIEEIASNSEVRVCVIHGGDKNFAAGADIKAINNMSAADFSDWNGKLNSAITALSKLEVPVIAAIRGYALGGGLEIALAADLRIGSKICTLGLPEIKLGIHPGAGGTQRLTQIVGRSKAKMLIMTGKHLSAPEALDLGIIDELVDDDKTVSRAMELAESIAQAPTGAIRAIKKCIDFESTTSDEAIAYERESIVKVFDTSERTELMSQFIKRSNRG